MTPKRVKEIANGCCNYICGNGRDFDAINLAITQAVNEALEEAAKVCTDYGAMYCHNSIRALKLPEDI